MSAQRDARRHVLDFRWHQYDSDLHPVAAKMRDLVILIEAIEVLYEEYCAEVDHQ